MEVRKILEKVQSGEWSIADAENHLKMQPFEELGFAKLDTHREVRSGFSEVIYCAGKPDEYLVSIFRKCMKRMGKFLVHGQAPNSMNWCERFFPWYSMTVWQRY